MSARRRSNMRRLVDNTLELVSSGEVSHETAAVQLLAAGVPVSVIGRVLATVPLVHPKSPTLVASAAMPRQLPRFRPTGTAATVAPVLMV